MKKYKVEFVKTETFVIDVLAENEAEAKTKAEDKWIEIGEQGIDRYHQIDNTKITIKDVYDVTETDDPFNPD